MNLSDFFAEIADHFCGIIQPRVHGSGGLLEVFGNGLAEGVEPLLQGPELLLQEQQRLVWRRLGFVPLAQNHHQHHPHSGECEQT